MNNYGVLPFSYLTAPSVAPLQVPAECGAFSEFVGTPTSIATDPQLSTYVHSSFAYPNSSVVNGSRYDDVGSADVDDHGAVPDASAESDSSSGTELSEREKTGKKGKKRIKMEEDKWDNDHKTRENEWRDRSRKLLDSWGPPVRDARAHVSSGVVDAELRNRAEATLQHLSKSHELSARMQVLRGHPWKCLYDPSTFRSGSEKGKDKVARGKCDPDRRLLRVSGCVPSVPDAEFWSAPAPCDPRLDVALGVGQPLARERSPMSGYLELCQKLMLSRMGMAPSQTTTGAAATPIHLSLPEFEVVFFFLLVYVLLLFFTFFFGFRKVPIGPFVLLLCGRVIVVRVRLQKEDHRERSEKKQ